MGTTISCYIICMINKLEAIALVKDFLNSDLKREEWFMNVEPFVKAYILYGSVAKETNAVDSDIDVLIILPLEQEEKFTKGEYVYNYRNNEINIVLRSIEKLRLIAQEKTDTFQKEVFRKSEVIQDVDGEVTELLQTIVTI